MAKRSPKLKSHDPTFPYFIPVDRVAKILRDYIDRNPADDLNPNVFGLHLISHRTGIAPRVLYGILRGDRAHVTFEIVDRLLIGLDLIDLWHYSPEDGGLADFYERETEQPPLALPTPEQQAFREADNAKRRERKRRKKAQESVAA